MKTTADIINDYQSQQFEAQVNLLQSRSALHGLPTFFSDDEARKFLDAWSQPLPDVAQKKMKDGSGKFDEWLSISF